MFGEERYIIIDTEQGVNFSASRLSRRTKNCSNPASNVRLVLKTTSSLLTIFFHSAEVKFINLEVHVVCFL